MYRVTVPPPTSPITSLRTITAATIAITTPSTTNTLNLNPDGNVQTLRVVARRTRRYSIHFPLRYPRMHTLSISTAMTLSLPFPLDLLPLRRGAMALQFETPPNQCTLGNAKKGNHALNPNRHEVKGHDIERKRHRNFRPEVLRDTVRYRHRRRNQSICNWQRRSLLIRINALHRHHDRNRELVVGERRMMDIPSTLNLTVTITNTITITISVTMIVVVRI
jgi:hypothetical protein